jgi:hypothetical protein
MKLQQEQSRYKNAVEAMSFRPTLAFGELPIEPQHDSIQTYASTRTLLAT